MFDLLFVFAPLLAVFSVEKMVLLTEIVPNFKANSTLGPIDFHEYIEGSWAVRLSQLLASELQLPSSISC